MTAIQQIHSYLDHGRGGDIEERGPPRLTPVFSFAQHRFSKGCRSIDDILGGKGSTPTTAGARARCDFVKRCRRDRKEKLMAQAVFSLSAERAEG